MYCTPPCVVHTCAWLLFTQCLSPQAVHFKKDDPVNGDLINRYIKTLTHESIVDITGTVLPSESEVKSCSISDREVSISAIHTISRAAAILPFQIEDASRSSASITASQDTDRPFPRLGQEMLLDYRWLDLRVPGTASIMKIRAGTTQLFREYVQRGNVESERSAYRMTSERLDERTPGRANAWTSERLDERTVLRWRWV